MPLSPRRPPLTGPPADGPPPRRALRVAVVVVTWNGRDALARCLEALDRQERPAEETVVVDNGSSDGTTDWLVPARPDIRVVALPGNAGFAAAAGAGLRQTTTDLVVVLEHDTAPAPGFLAALHRAALAAPHAAALAPLIVHPPAGEYAECLGFDFTAALRAVPRLAGYRTAAAATAGAGPCGAPSPVAALYRREALADAGFLDAAFFLDGATEDLALRFHARSWEIRTCPEAIVLHHGNAHADGPSGHERDVYQRTRARLPLLVRHLPRPLLARSLAALAAESLATLPRLLVRGHGVPWLRGWRAAVAALPAARRVRADLAARRTAPAARLRALLGAPSAVPTLPPAR